MSDNKDDDVSVTWLGRLVLGRTVADVRDRLSAQGERIATLEAQLAQREEEIERLRLSLLVLERKLEAEASERDTVARALFERIEAARG